MTAYIILNITPLLLLGFYVFILFHRRGKTYLTPLLLISFSLISLVLHTSMSFFSAYFIPSISNNVESLLELLRIISLFQGMSLLLGMIFLVYLEVKKANCYNDRSQSHTK